MLKRLQAKKSYFNVTSWTKEEVSRKKILRNIKQHHGDQVDRHQYQMESTLFDAVNLTSSSYFQSNNSISGKLSNSFSKTGGIFKKTPRKSLSRKSSLKGSSSKSPLKTAIGAKRASIESFGVKKSSRSSTGRSQTVDAGA